MSDDGGVGAVTGTQLMIAAFLLRRDDIAISAEGGLGGSYGG